MKWLHNRNTHAILRLIEVISIVIGTVGIGILTATVLIADSKIRQQQTELINQIKIQQRTLQDDMDRVISSKADAGIIVALLTQFCSKEGVDRTFATFLTETNDLDRKQISQIILHDCKDSFNQINVNPKYIEAEDEYNIIAARFVKEVRIGREFYSDHLWEKAAEIWNEAAGSIPPFLAKGMIDDKKLGQAMSAYRQEQFEVSADLFKVAFQKIGSDSK